MPLAKNLIEAAGNATQANYIEDVFSTYLYTGNSGTQTITNNIDLSTKGGMVWIKGRDIATNNLLFDTNRGVNNYLVSDGTNAQANPGDTLSAFNANGFTVKDLSNFINETGFNYASWTFRKQPKFFDIQTWTGNATARTISHNLGSVPGCIIVKSVSAGGNSWYVYHRSIDITGGKVLLLNGTNAALSNGDIFNSTLATSTEFTIGVDSAVNATGVTNIAYIFAHDAGGFGLTGTDNVISCGSFTRTFGTANSVNLGYEPQWVLIKCTSQTDSWQLYDTMRGLSQTASLKLEPNSANSESNTAGMIPTATGFDITATGVGGGTFIYIAIRRGPMKVPTDGTKVFSPTAYTGDNSSNRIIGSLPAGDSALVFTRNYNDYGYPQTWWNRLTGGLALRPYNTNAEVSQATTLGWDNQIGQLISVGSTNINYGGSPAGNFILYNFKRAPSFFDEVCYTNTGSSQQVAFTTLGTTPELVIYKARGTTSDWYVLAKAGSVYHGLKLNTTAASAFNDTAANLGITSTYFDPAFGWGGPSSYTYVAYLFATCAGVSKVGSVTLAGSTVNVDCGFTAGARFVMLKRTSGVGDWYVFDTARGINAGNDPYLRLNSTAAEANVADVVDAYSAGFTVNGAEWDAGDYIYLAIA